MNGAAEFTCSVTRWGYFSRLDFTSLSSRRFWFRQMACIIRSAFKVGSDKIVNTEITGGGRDKQRHLFLKLTFLEGMQYPSKVSPNLLKLCGNVALTKRNISTKFHQVSCYVEGVGVWQVWDAQNLTSKISKKSPKFKVDFRWNLTLFWRKYVYQILDRLTDAGMFPFKKAIPNALHSHIRSKELR